MDRTFRLIARMAKRPAFRSASEKAEELKRKMKRANKFTAPSIAAEASEFFRMLGEKSPEIRMMLRIEENEIRSLEIEKKTGLRLILD